MAIARWSKPARQDLDNVDLYYRQIDPQLANRIGDAALAAARYLADNPMLGPAIEGSGFRKWNVAAAPYVILYRPEPTGVRVLRIRHNRENWRP